MSSIYAVHPDATDDVLCKQATRSLMAMFRLYLFDSMRLRSRSEERVVRQLDLCRSCQRALITKLEGNDDAKSVSLDMVRNPPASTGHIYLL